MTATVPAAPAAVAVPAADRPAPVATAAAIAEELRPLARTWDREDAFPVAALDLLRASGLMGLMVPVEYGGLGGRTAELSACARALAGGDLSSAMIWSMHSQQVAVLAAHASPALKERVLPRIASGEVYIASATTEPGKGGHLLSAVASLHADAATVRLSRNSPVVTGGGFADGFLVTMRRSAEAQDSDVVLVYADRGQLSIETRGGWEMLGMRATQSVAMQLDGMLPADQVVDPPYGFGLLAASTMIPVGHIAWSSSWLGAAEEVVRGYVRLLRDPARGSRAASMGELALHRLARIRLRLDVADAYLRQAVRNYDHLVAEHGPGASFFGSPGFNIEINNLKVVVSEEVFSVVDELVTLAGLGLGYARNAPIPLERAFRDLRSAALMYANDRLLGANGKLCLVDRDLRRVGLPGEAALAAGTELADPRGAP